MFWGYVQTFLLCIIFLAGMGGGLFVLLSRNKVAGLLTMVGFLLFGIELLVNPLIYQFAVRIIPMADFRIIQTVYLCISVPAVLLGTCALVAGVIVASSPKKTEPQAGQSSNSDNQIAS